MFVGWSENLEPQIPLDLPGQQEMFSLNREEQFLLVQKSAKAHIKSHLGR